MVPMSQALEEPLNASSGFRRYSAPELIPTAKTSSTISMKRRDFGAFGSRREKRELAMMRTPVTSYSTDVPFRGSGTLGAGH